MDNEIQPRANFISYFCYCRKGPIPCILKINWRGHLVMKVIKSAALKILQNSFVGLSMILLCFNSLQEIGRKWLET